jgi:hypothetical protein
MGPSRAAAGTCVGYTFHLHAPLHPWMLSATSSQPPHPHPTPTPSLRTPPPPPPPSAHTTPHHTTPHHTTPHHTTPHHTTPHHTTPHTHHTPAGTLTNSDPLHYIAFREILAELGYDGGRPISEAFFRQRISGRHNPEIAADLFPAWSQEAHVRFYEDKEARFRALAGAGLRAWCIECAASLAAGTLAVLLRWLPSLLVWTELQAGGATHMIGRH